ncbi:MAG: hypothetical protein E7111_00055 [Bacteroidales bacterium]|nr:hypothetical protein [Bacteroidales bacterium]
MKRLSLMLFCVLFLGQSAFSQDNAYSNNVGLDIIYEGESLSARNIEKIERMSEYMTDFYSKLGLSDDLQIHLKVFKTQEEGYGYINSIYPDRKQYRKTRSDEYFGTGTSGLYIPKMQTAVILGLEQGIDRGVRVIFHELSHHFTRRLFENRTPPIWLNEGLAEHFESMTYSKKNGWTSDVSDMEKGRLRTLYMLGELDLEGLFDMSRNEFMAKHKNEGQVYYSFAHVAVVVLMKNLDHSELAVLMSRLDNRSTDVIQSSVVSDLFPGGMEAYKRAVYEFIR